MAREGLDNPRRFDDTRYAASDPRDAGTIRAAEPQSHQQLAGPVAAHGGSTIMDRPAADAPAPLLTQDSQRLAASQRGTSPARRLWSRISADRRRLVQMLLWQFLQVLTFVPFTIGDAIPGRRHLPVF